MAVPRSGNPGGLESPYDPRDWTLDEIGQGAAEIPAVFLPDYSSLPTYDQGRTPACGGHSGAWLKMFLDWVSTDEIRAYSPRFVYAMCKKYDGLPNVDGTHIHAIMQVLKDSGVCDEARFPNLIDLPARRYIDLSELDQDDYDNALPRVIRHYAFVKDKSFEGLKQAIYENKVVLVLKKPWVPQFSSGHFFVLTGYDENRIRYRNSFGAWWNDRGDGWLSRDDVKTIIEGVTAVDLDDATVQALIDKRNSLLFKLRAELQKAIKRLGGKPVV